ncbi:uncharacterized protein LOC117331519 [Pecten maximus]|uniref:uncharacterized protein LOC117331519 n=1 Tax=Pecten maximus TaxID=6579 RepID=UPI0014583DB5|nr:uncharacterized protein LOC117331519 [Pecten maximus]
MTIECSCGNRHPKRFLYYQPFGIFCRCCNTEWLSDNTANPDSAEDGPRVPRLRMYRFRDVSRHELHENNVLLVQSSRSRVTDINQLVVGDHIAFHRPYVIWHHCIVIEVNAEDSTLEVINWQSENGSVSVIQQQIDVSKEYGDLYRIQYTSDIQLSNPPHLVIARARSRLSQTGFHIFDDNCESFATFCKTGISKSHQYIWLVAKTWEWLVHFTVMTVRTAITGFCTLARVAAGCVGPVVVIVLEGIILAWDVIKAYRERRNGNLSRNEYAKIAIRRIVDGVVTVAFTIVGVIIGVSFTVTGPMIPCLLAGACGGIVGMTVGKVGGTLLGCWVGRAIANCLKTDDRAVDKITELVPGDHVVMTRWALHPRCHGILIEHDSHTKIRVVRNTYKYGVVDEWLPFEKPLYLVTHKKNECFSNEEVLRRAKGQIGARRYNIASHNCKTFANWCKRHT